MPHDQRQRSTLVARHYQSGAVLCISWVAGKITSVQEITTPVGEIPWVAPALFDLQINGCMGKAFVSPELQVEDVTEVLSFVVQHGISGICPTLITGPHDALAHGFSLLRQSCEQNSWVGKCMTKFHLEGPFISPEDGPRGAHPRDHVRRPDRDEFHRLQDLAGGRIGLVTLSPEYDESLAFIETLVKEGVVVAIGHTAATPQRIREAVVAGARLSTHLGNGCHAVLSRHENYLWEQLACDALHASVIADGHHLPEAVLRSILRGKRQKVILTCDASSLAGLPAGRYPMWGHELEVLEHGKVVVPGTPFLAGSGVFLDSCIRHLLGLREVTLSEAMEMASTRPRQLLGLEAVGLWVGSPADLVVFTHDPNTSGEEFRVVKTILSGFES